MARLTKAQLCAAGLRRKELLIPDTDGSVLIRELSTPEYKAYIALLSEAAKSESEDEQLGCTADLVVTGVIEDNGKPVFESRQQVLDSGMSLATIAFIARAVATLSGMSGEKKE